MELENLQKQLSDEQKKLAESIRALERVLEAACIKISKLSYYDKWWLDIGFRHIKEGANALVMAACVNITPQMIEQLRKKGGSNNEGCDGGNEGSDTKVHGQ